MLEFIRALAIRGEFHSRTALRDHDERPVPEKRMVRSLDRLIDETDALYRSLLDAVPASSRIGLVAEPPAPL